MQTFKEPFSPKRSSSYASQQLDTKCGAMFSQRSSAAMICINLLQRVYNVVYEDVGTLEAWAGFWSSRGRKNKMMHIR